MEKSRSHEPTLLQQSMDLVSSQAASEKNGDERPVLGPEIDTRAKSRQVYVTNQEIEGLSLGLGLPQKDLGRLGGGYES